jgi:hypothetical protein
MDPAQRGRVRPCGRLREPASCIRRQRHDAAMPDHVTPFGPRPPARGPRGAAPQTVPHAPPAKPSEQPAPERTAPEPQPQRKLDPFQPEWPETRPTPEPKARLRA